MLPMFREAVGSINSKIAALGVKVIFKTPIIHGDHQCENQRVPFPFERFQVARWIILAVNCTIKKKKMLPTMLSFH